MPTLLPHRFKWVGLVSFLLIIAVAVGVKLIMPDFLEENKAQLKPIAQSLLILALLVTVLSKEKIEDEFIEHCRLRAFGMSLVFGVALAIGSAFESTASSPDISGFNIITAQLFFCIVFFWLLKSNIFMNAKQG